jgi:hypothetical protein
MSAFVGPIFDLSALEQYGAAPFNGGTGPGSSWVNGGNSLTAPGTLGTTTAQPFSLISNNVTRATVAATGEVAIGPSAPTAGQIFAVQGSGTQSINLTAGSGTSAWTVAAGGTLNLSANATDHTTVLGSITGVSATAVFGGTGGIGIGTAPTGLSGVIIDATNAGGAVRIAQMNATTLTCGSASTLAASLNSGGAGNTQVNFGTGGLGIGTAPTGSSQINMDTPVPTGMTIAGVNCNAIAIGNNTCQVGLAGSVIQLTTTNTGFVSILAGNSASSAFSSQSGGTVGIQDAGLGPVTATLGRNGSTQACTTIIGNTVTASTTSISGGAGGSAITLTQGTCGTITVGGTAAGDALLLQSGTGNLGIFAGATGNVSLGATTGSFGNGQRVLFVANAVANPNANPTGGGILYATAGAGTWRGSGGTTTTFGPAARHCETCGSDFGIMYEHDEHDEAIAVCFPCLVEAMQKANLPTHFAHVFKRNPKLTKADRLPRLEAALA